MEPRDISGVVVGAGLKSFADLCESRGVKSSREILPGADTEPGIYILSA